MQTRHDVQNVRNDAAALRQDVRAHYTHAIVRQGCCGTASRAPVLYDAATLAGLGVGPQPASFGCGNPFASARLSPREVVLDLGAGAGLDLLLAAQQVGSTGRVYGLDMTDEMLAAAQTNLTRAGVHQVVLLRGDLEAIPLPAGTVDVIISNCVVNLVPDKAAAFREMARVLRPGGRLAISDIVVEGGLSDFPVTAQAIRASLSWAGCLAGACDTADLRAGLSDAGFCDVAVEVAPASPRPSLVTRLIDTVGPLPDGVPERIADRFRSAAISAVRP